MSVHKDDRQFEYEVKYLRKVLKDIGGGIELPYSLGADVMRTRLDTVTQKAEPHIARSAARFLRARVFSLQSAVSYAVAFVLIMAVAYGMRLNGGYIDGSIALKAQQSDVSTANKGTAEVFAADAMENAISETVAMGAESTAGEASSDLSGEGSASSRQQADIFKADDPIGIGGGARAVTLGRDDSFIYLYRLNDASDPDKTGFPITVEIIETESGEHSAFIDIPDISEPLALYSAPGAVCLVGRFENGLTARAYEAVSGDEGVFWSETMVFSQPGEYIGSRYFEGFLYITADPGMDYEGEALILPDAAMDNICAITAADTRTGSISRIILSGADRDILMHDWNIYVSYTAITSDDEADSLGMVQVKLDGLNMEVVAVP